MRCGPPGVATPPSPPQHHPLHPSTPVDFPRALCCSVQRSRRINGPLSRRRKQLLHELRPSCRSTWKSAAIYVTSHGAAVPPLAHRHTLGGAFFSPSADLVMCWGERRRFSFRGQTCRLSTLHSNGLYQPQCRESWRLEQEGAGV